MTFVCAWKDSAFGYERVVVLADSLITEEPEKNVIKPLANRAVKIMKVPVRCFRVEDLRTPPNSTSNPWKFFDVGLAYTGYCLESLYIAELVRRSFDSLISDDHTPTQVSFIDLARIIAGIAKAYFAEHNATDRQDVTFFVFGYCLLENKLKLVRVACKKDEAIITDLDFDALPLHWIGQAIKDHDTELQLLLKRLQRRHTRLPSGLEDDVEQAKAEIAQINALIWNTENQLSDEGPLAVGGTVQAAEAFLDAHLQLPVILLNDSMAGLLPAIPVTEGGWQPLVTKDAMLRRR